MERGGWGREGGRGGDGRGVEGEEGAREGGLAREGRREGGRCPSEVANQTANIM